MDRTTFPTSDGNPEGTLPMSYAFPHSAGQSRKAARARACCIEFRRLVRGLDCESVHDRNGLCSSMLPRRTFMVRFKCIMSGAPCGARWTCRTRVARIPLLPLKTMAESRTSADPTSCRSLPFSAPSSVRRTACASCRMLHHTALILSITIVMAWFPLSCESGPIPGFRMAVENSSQWSGGACH